VSHIEQGERMDLVFQHIRLKMSAIIFNTIQWCHPS